MFPRFPILRLQNWRDQEGRDFDPMSPMPGSLFRTDTWYWAVLRARHEQVLSPTEVLFVIPDFTNREVLVQHPVEQIAWFIRGWMEFRLLRVLRAPCRILMQRIASHSDCIW